MNTIIRSQHEDQNKPINEILKEAFLDLYADAGLDIEGLKQNDDHTTKDKGLDTTMD